jgi:hypothetical protein
MKLPDQELLGSVETVREVGGQIVVSLPGFDEDERAEIERTVRITAMRALPDGKYWSSYEEPVELKVEDGRRTVWAKAAFLPVSADTADDCLRGAVEVVGRGVGRTADGEQATH